MTNPSGVRIELETITPKMARELLGRSLENQRNLRKTKVDQYARDMAVGHWPITGDTIKVTSDGRLVDGQHRLAAIVQADIPVRLPVAYGVDEAVMPVLDTGLARSFADVLRVGGTPHRSLVSSIVRRIVQWERGNYVGGGGGGVGLYEYPTHTEMLERLEKDTAGFVAAAGRGEDVRRARLGLGMSAGTAFFLFSDIRPDMAHAFFDAYLVGANLPPRHPILTLRNRMTRIGRDERLLHREQLALFCRAWNAYRTDRPLGSVMVTAAGRTLTNQNFPIPK